MSHRCAIFMHINISSQSYFPLPIIDLESFFILLQIKECRFISKRIGEVISLAGESDQAITSSEYIPKEFFNDMESSWKGRVKRVHAEEEFANVDVAAQALSTAVCFKQCIFLI